MEKLNAALIGYGYWGPNWARVIAESDNCTLAYCADTNIRAREDISKKYPSTKVTANYKEALAASTVDAVFVITPTKTHYTIVKDALKSGKHVFVEKPLTYTATEANELVQLAKANDVKLMVGHIFLFNPAVNFIKQTIDDGTLGKIRHMFFQRRNLGPIRQDVNVLWDLAPHDISMALHFIGQKPVAAVATGISYLQAGVHDVVSATIIFPDNILVNMLLSWIDPIKIRDVTIVGDKKMVLFDDVPATEKVKIFDKNVNIMKSKQDGSFGEYQISLNSGNVVIPAIQNKEPLKEEFNHFIKALTINEPILSDGANGLVVVQVLEALQESLEHNSKMVKL